jgi:CBS domain containing-hemolysin-like protein
MEIDVLIIITALLFSAFFSGMEIAYVSANKIHIELEKKQDGILAKVLRQLTLKPSKFIATMLVGNNIALVIYGFFMGDVLVDWLQETEWLQQYISLEYKLLFQTVISTLVILVTAEFLPKVFFQVYANNLLKFLAIPAYFFYQLFWLISEFVMWISNVVLKKFFKTEGDEVQLEFSKVELGDYISEQMEAGHDDDIVDSEIQIFQNALEFSAVKSREVMIPRTEIVAIELHESISNLAKLFSETGYSKILVYKNTIDDIIYVHSFELFKKPKTIRSIVLPVVFVPEAMLVNDVLNVLTKKRKSIAVVLDEYGGTSGIVTVEDIVEELFGEIEDEHDVTELLEKRIGEYEYLFSARLEVDYINEVYKLNLPESENYETLGGLIVSETEEIPQQDEVVVINNLKFTMVEVSNTKIDTIQLQILSSD